MYITTYPNDVLAWWCRDPEEPRAKTCVEGHPLEDDGSHPSGFCPLGKRERVTPAKALSPTSDPKRPRVDIHEEGPAKLEWRGHLLHKLRAG